MKSVYDWVTVAIFAGIVALFLERSMAKEEPRQHDSLWLYLAAALGVAVADWLGNNGYDLLAVPLIAATLLFVLYYLRPFKFWPRS